jgi:hypothetical protein
MKEKPQFELFIIKMKKRKKEKKRKENFFEIFPFQTVKNCPTPPLVHQPVKDRFRPGCGQWTSPSGDKGEGVPFILCVLL